MEDKASENESEIDNEWEIENDWIKYIRQLLVMETSLLRSLLSTRISPAVLIFEKPSIMIFFCNLDQISE